MSRFEITVIMLELDKNSHSVFLLHFRLVLVIKYRKQVVDDEISSRLRALFDEIAPEYGVVIYEWNHDKDHIHILYKARPDTVHTKFINHCKSVSSRIIKQEFPRITDKLWKSAFWSKGYCLVSSGGSSVDIAKKYIEEQGL